MRIAYFREFQRLMEPALRAERKLAGAPYISWPDWCDLGGAAMQPYTSRIKLVRTYSWAIPTPAAIALLLRYAPLVEMGAGGGYWAYLVRERGGDIIAYDHHPSTRPTGDADWLSRRVWTEVLRGHPSTLRKHPDRALFLCWPPMDSMAERSARLWRGEYLIYAGEHGGCTAGDGFFNYLARNFEEVEQLRLPQWPAIHDSLTVYRRKDRRPGSRARAPRA